MAQYEEERYPTENVINDIKNILSSKYSGREDELKKTIHDYVDTKYKDGKGIGSMRGYIMFDLGRDSLAVEKLMDGKLGGKSKRKSKRNKKSKKRKTRKSQKGGDIGQIIGATALGAVLLLGASQLSRNKTKKPVLNKSIDSKAISSRSLESKAFADRIQAKAASKAAASRRESKIHPDMRNKVRVFAEETAKQLNGAKKLNDSQDSQAVISARASSVSKPSSIPKSNNWVTNSEKRIRTPAERRANGMHKESKQKKHKITEAQIQKKKTQKRSRYTSRKRPR